MSTCSKLNPKVREAFLAISVYHQIHGNILQNPRMHTEKLEKVLSGQEVFRSRRRKMHHLPMRNHRLFPFQR